MQLLVRDRDFYKTALMIAVPVVAQSIINISVNLVDTIMLGSLGDVQIAGSSLGNQFFFIFNVLCLGMGGGAAVMTGQYWGIEDTQSFRKTLALMWRVCVSFALLFSLLAFTFPRQILSIYTKDPEVIVSGARYLRILAFAFLFHGLNLTTIIVLRTARIVRIGLLASLVAFLVKLFFNWVLISGIWERLGWRLQAAITTVIARICEFSVTFGYLLWFDERLKVKITDFFRRIDLHIVKQFIHMAVPVIVSDGLLTLGNNALAMIMGRMGTAMVAAHAITNVTMQLSTVATQGLSGTSSVMTSNTVGREEYDKAQAQGYTFLTLSVFIGIFAGIFILVTKPFVLSLYNVTAETRAVASQLLSVMALIVLFQCVQSVMTKGVLRGGGDTKFLMLADALFLWVASIL